MRRNCRQSWAVLAAGIVIAGAAGCPDNDPLESGNVNVAFATGAVNPPPGTDYECVVLDIVSLEFRHADGACSSDSTNAGTPCGLDDQCPSPGSCQTNRCSGDSTNPGAICGNDNDCLPNPPVGGPGTCGACSAGSDVPGLACDTNEQCPPRSICEGTFAQDVLGSAPVNPLGASLGFVDFLSTSCKRCTEQGTRFCTATANCDLNNCVDLVCAATGVPCTNDQGCLPNVCEVSEPALPSLVLTEGRYAISQFEIRNLLLFDAEGNPTVVGCDGFADVIPAFDEPLTFTVGRGRSNVVRLTLDLQGIVNTDLGDTCGEKVGDGSDTFFGQIDSILSVED